MTDGMDIYRAYLSAQTLAERLHAAHHSEGNREHHLRAAVREITETHERIGIAVRAITAPADAPA